MQIAASITTAAAAGVAGVYASKTALTMANRRFRFYNPDGSGGDHHPQHLRCFDADGAIEVVDTDGRSVALNGFN